MADEEQDLTTLEADIHAESGAPEQKQPRVARIIAVLRRHWVVAAIVALVAINATVFAVIKLRSGGIPPSTEVTLGTFSFEAPRQPGNPITHAEFVLHISLLDDARYRGRALLSAKRHKVQQEIEQLLRQAHGADFDDPTLTELKRQLQAMINKTLGQRVVAEILITELSVDRVAAIPEPTKGNSAGGGSIWQEVEEGGSG